MAIMVLLLVLVLAAPLLAPWSPFTQIPSPVDICHRGPGDKPPACRTGGGCWPKTPDGPRRV
jgi:hypothetical protein